jgi:hypothetical protein
VRVRVCSARSGIGFKGELDGDEEAPSTGSTVPFPPARAEPSAFSSALKAIAIDRTRRGP